MATTKPNTETDAPPATSPKPTDKVLEVPMAGTEPKTKTDAPPTSTPNKPADKVSEVLVAGTEPKTKTDAPPTSTPNKPADKVSEVPVASTEPKSETDDPPKQADKVSEVPMDGTKPTTETDAPPTSTPKSTVNAPQIKTVEVGNIAIAVTKKEIWEFFTFSGDIHYIEVKRESDNSQRAFVTFKDSQGADTAVLLTGATIADLSVSVSHVENYQLPPEAPPLTPPPSTDEKQEVAQKAEEVVSTMLAKGFVLGKDALQKAKSFDEKHQLTSNASAKVASLDRKMGLSQKLSMGTAAVNEKMKEVNERYQVTEATKSAVAVVEQKASNAGSALMSNQYVSSGAVWFSGAFAAFAKAAEGVGSKTKEKVEKAEEEKKEALDKEGANTVNDQTPFQLGESSTESSPATPVKSSNDDSNLPKK